MPVLKTDDRGSVLELAQAGLCPACESAIDWAWDGPASGLARGAHEKCGLRFSLVVNQLTAQVMDWHGTPVVEVPNPTAADDGIPTLLVPKAGAPEAPAPAPTRARLQISGHDKDQIADLSGIAPRPSTLP